MCKKIKKITNRVDPERERLVKEIKTLASKIKKSGITEKYFND